MCRPDEFPPFPTASELAREDARERAEDARYSILIQPTDAERVTIAAALDDAMSLDVRYKPGTLRILQELRRLFAADF